MLLFVGLGVLLGFLLSWAFGFRDASGPRKRKVLVGVGLILAAVGLYFFVRVRDAEAHGQAEARLPAEKLPQPIVNERGVTQTQRSSAGRTSGDRPAGLDAADLDALLRAREVLRPFVLAGIGLIVALINIGPALVMR